MMKLPRQEVRLIGLDGENVGVVAISEAQQIAQDADLDLVEIAPNATPPVCRVMDYGKFKFQQSKKAQVARKKQKTDPCEGNQVSAQVRRKAIIRLR